MDPIGRPTRSAPERIPHRRTYVLDTSVLLADPAAIARFEEHHVVLPLVVLTELEAKRHHPELGWAARAALRSLEELRVAHRTLTEPLPVNGQGGTIRVEINHLDSSGLPLPLSAGHNDHRILAVAANLLSEGHEVVLVTKDLPLRLMAGVVGVEAEEYRHEMVHDSGWTGVIELSVSASVIDRLFAERVVDLDEARDLAVNTGLILTADDSGSALARIRADKRVHLVPGDRELFGVRGRSAEQRLALEMLADDSVGIVSLGGPAGTGKSVLALAAGLEAVIERATHKRVLVFRPLYAVGGQDLGFLPGDETEKMSPWAAAVTDALELVAGRSIIDEVMSRELLEVLPLTHIRGRSLNDTFIIVDEAQNLEHSVLLTALSRIGTNSRVVLTHDVAQRDNLRVGRHDGIAAVVERLRDHPLFAHLTLSRSERSPVAALVTSVLDDHR